MEKRYSIGFFPGVWDLLHLGHIKALKEAKEYCDYLIVGIKVDPSIDQKNKHKPILSLEERVEILFAIKYVNEIYSYKTEKELHVLDKSELFDVRFMGEDHKKKHHFIKAKIIYVSRKHNYSSSNIRKRIYETERKYRA